MTDWATKPQPVGNSRWRFPLPSELPDGRPRHGRGRSRALDDRQRLPLGHLPDGGERTAGRARLVVAGSAGHCAPRSAARHAVDASERQAIRDSGRHLFRARHPRMRRSVARRRAGSAKHFITAYTRLHELGWAHSVEVFDRRGQLAGGLYGVRVDGLFAGESMFHLERDASKVALMALVDLMRASGMPLLDVQWCTDHLASLGAVPIARHEYLARLADALSRERSPGPHSPLGPDRSRSGLPVMSPPPRCAVSGAREVRRGRWSAPERARLRA